MFPCKNKLLCLLCSPEGLEQDSASASSGVALRGRSAVGRKHRFDLAARTLLARAGKDFPLCPLLRFSTCSSYFISSHKTFLSSAGLYRSVQAHHSQSRREVSSLQQQQDPAALYDFNLDEELEMDLDEETMEAMFGQDLASDTDILGMWIPEVLDWPTWVCVTLCYGQRAAITTLLCVCPRITSSSQSSHVCTLTMQLYQSGLRDTHLFSHISSDSCRGTNRHDVKDSTLTLMAVALDLSLTHTSNI